MTNLVMYWKLDQFFYQTTLKLKRYGFKLTKSEFRDWIWNRYKIEAKNCPINWPCGEKYTL